MTHSKKLLKNLRTESPLDQKDMARLLDMKPSNLVRYEHGHRNPTPELQLVYHMLFDVSLRDLFASIYKETVDVLMIRIKNLIADLEMEESPKSKHKVSFLKEIVNKIITDSSYESTT
ncbi:HTH cro/C1-type domain-containing protein [Tenacibaculum sp. 190524A02b]|uniref:helix-turn-helix domain-containing protein n=1 Tax=Tenacibaculum vairaonense TaxID=3137860 RepID=UPI0032B1E4FE